MKVCGIELKASEARVVVLEGDVENYEIVHTDVTKFKLADSKDQKEVQRFRGELLEYFSWIDCEKIGIKERMSKGRFAGGALSFKIEGMIQTADYPVVLVHGMSMKSKLKDLVFDIEHLPKYQAEAFKVALYLLVIEG